MFAALKVKPARIDSYCQAVDEPILEEIRKLPSGASMDQLKDRWYRGRDGSDYHYHQSRYHALNLHSVFYHGTVEWRLFNSTLHAGEAKANIVLSMAISAQAINQKYTQFTDYAIVPLMAQVEYPADGSRTDVLLPENVTLLDYYGEPAQDATVLHSEYAETSAAATGLYLLTDGDFTVQLVYTAPDGNALTQNLNVVIDRSSTAAPPFADMGVAPYAGRPTPSVTSGRITKVAKVNATWLIWFNGEPAYCCTHGANGQPNGCPPYSYSHTSTVGADQCIPGDHYGNQIRIWGGLNQLSLDEDGDFPAVFCAEDEAELSVSDFCEMIYDDLQLFIMQHYPDSRAAALYRESAEELLNGVQTYTAEAGYYTYIYQPAASGWQTVALIGPAIEGEEPEPEPVPQEYYADWQAPAQTAGGSFDLTFTVNTDKYQLNTPEKVDGAVITVTPSRTGGSVDGGSWQMSPAGAQTITTSGHTPDDNFHLNGGDGFATWTVHYEVSKTSTSTFSGQEGPFTSQAEADAAAEAAKNAAIGQLQNEAQGMVDAAIAAARAQLANITFSYDEITIPHGFDSTPGALGSHQTITVPANSSNDYKMQNDEWSVKVSIDKIDSETKQRIKGDAEFKIFEWDTVRRCYIPFGGYNQYKVERQSDGTSALRMGQGSLRIFDVRYSRPWRGRVTTLYREF